MTHPEIEPLAVAKVYVIGVARWKYECDSVEQAIACVHQLAAEIARSEASLDMFEVMVEFTTGESERCAYRNKSRVKTWLKRFQT